MVKFSFISYSTFWLNPKSSKKLKAWNVSLHKSEIQIGGQLETRLKVNFFIFSLSISKV